MRAECLDDEINYRIGIETVALYVKAARLDSRVDFLHN